MTNLDDSLVLFLKLDEIGDNNTVEDLSGNENHGTVQGAQVMSDDLFGSCIEFNGDGDYIDLGKTALNGAFAYQSYAFTVTAWVKPTTLNPDNGNDIPNTFFAKGSCMKLGLGDQNIWFNLESFIGTSNPNYNMSMEEIIVDNWLFLTAIYEYKDQILTIKQCAASNSGQLICKPRVFSNQDGGGLINPKDGLAASNGKVIIGKSSDSSVETSYFKGRIARVRVYNEALGEDDLTEIMRRDIATSAALSSSPLVFSSYNDDSQPAIYIGNGDENLLHFEITNNTRFDLSLDNISNQPDSENFHFEVKFRPGVISIADIETIEVKEGDAWSYNIEQQDDMTLSILLIYIASDQITANETIGFTLLNLVADPVGGSRGTRLELRFKSLSYDGEEDPLAGHLEQVLNIVSHVGRKDIPLHFGFEGSNTILNDGSTENQLVLRISNMDKEKAIPLNADSAQTRILLWFDCGDEDWALANKDGVSDIEVNATSEGWTATQETQTECPIWSITSDNNELGPDESISITLSKIKSDTASGHTHLYIQYENFSGFWDGKEVLIIEKSPLLYLNKQVAINRLPQEDSDLALDIKGKTRLYRSLLLQNDGNTGKERFVDIQLNHKNGTGAQIRGVRPESKDYGMSLLFYTQPVGENETQLEQRMIIDSEGNVGIGTDNPTNKLEVVGGKTKLEQEGWQNIDLYNGWTWPVMGPFGENFRPKLYRDSLGIVHLKGIAFNLKGDGNDAVLKIPPAYAPVAIDSNAVAIARLIVLGYRKDDLDTDGGGWVGLDIEPESVFVTIQPCNSNLDVPCPDNEDPIFALVINKPNDEEKDYFENLGISLDGISYRAASS